ncbi:MAG: glycerate kinase [Spirochaetes bacterium]|nr:glycerate kinase [Spirochaetota bacterium]
MNPRDDIRTIYMHAIEAVDPYTAVRSSLLREGSILRIKNGKAFDLSAIKNIYVVGAGKATARMAKAVEDILGDSITQGIIAVKYGYRESLSHIILHEAAHPVPDENGLKASQEIIDLLGEAGEHDLVISCISGGGSALLPYPVEPITLAQKQDLTQRLLRSGASIKELNIVRKHLSRTKGGNLALAAYPATVINLMMSDVVGDDMDIIASGPFVMDTSTYADALSILQRYNLLKAVAPSIVAHLEKGINGEIPETPKDKHIFEKVYNIIVASNIIACMAAQQKANELGYNSIILSSMIEGDTAEAARFHSAIAHEIIKTGNPVKTPACIISGGETTVVVKGSGLGGRNMEFAMQIAPLIEQLPVVAASIGTDGTDGPTDAAGAVADGKTIKKAKKLGLNINEYINNNDSYHFFELLGDLIITGPTNTNVMDIRILIVE